MANEAVFTASLQFGKTGVIPTQTFAVSGVSINVAGTNYVRNVQIVGTTKEALLLGDVATPGMCLMHNTDTTNFVDVYPDNTGGAVIRLKPTEYALFRFAATGPFVKADTASVNLEYLLLPD
jgi:hypothetical protein